jgi:dihydrolipoamide dehydrogenase
MMSKYDLVVIGAGPGGYVAAIRAAQLGLKVACVDKNSALGGTCLRVGCIPSKALLESSERFHEAKTSLAGHGVQVGGVALDLPTMLARKRRVVSTLTKGVAALFRKNGIDHIAGSGRIARAGLIIVDEENGSQELETERILIATGSTSATLPGVELDGDRIGTSTEALSYESVPKHLVVIGAGYIGLELGSVWQRLGAKVTVLEFLDRIFPGTDAEIASDARKIFAKQGIEFRLQSRVIAAECNGESCQVVCEGAEPIECDRALVAVGRRPNTQGLGLESVGISTDEGGRIVVDDAYETAVPTIYAVGDVIPGPMLAHKAEEEGVACVERFVTGYGHVNYDAIPSVVYTHPEIAAVGRTEEQLQAAGIDYRKGQFAFRGNGRARALGTVDGKVKILADATTDRILGVHIIGPRAGDLIAEAAVAINLAASAEDIAYSSHAHPTLAEALKEAALAVDEKALHA